MLILASDSGVHASSNQHTVSSCGRAPGREACGSDLASVGVGVGFWVNIPGVYAATVARRIGVVGRPSTALHGRLRAPPTHVTGDRTEEPIQLRRLARTAGRTALSWPSARRVGRTADRLTEVGPMTRPAGIGAGPANDTAVPIPLADDLATMDPSPPATGRPTPARVELADMARPHPAGAWIGEDALASRSSHPWTAWARASAPARTAEDPAVMTGSSVW